ncbi:hypothetical protein Agub_g13841, partial [Astrephomene gubernaculifera]
SRGNPGRAGFGAVLVECGSGRHVEYVAGPLSGTTNNVAEWSALAAGLQVALELGVRHLVARGDSELVCRQVEGRYGVNTPSLRPLAARVAALRGRLESFAVEHVPRSLNAVADRLSNLAMDAEQALAEVQQRGQADSQQRQDILKAVGEPALQAARDALAAAAASPRSTCTLTTTTYIAPSPGASVADADQLGQRVASNIEVTECAPLLATRGSLAGRDVMHFNRALIALAAAARGWLD